MASVRRTRRDVRMVTPEPAQIVHQSSGRLRLRLPQLRGAERELEALGDLLLQVDGVDQVSVNHRIGSLLLQHHSPDAALLAALFALGRLEISVPQISRLLVLRDSLSTGIDQFSVKDATIAALLVLGVLQLARGNIAPPAITALWYAFELSSNDLIGNNR